MTSSVTVSAHLVDTKQVHVRIKDKITGEIFKDVALQDGETETFNIFDNRELVVYEMEK